MAVVIDLNLVCIVCLQDNGGTLKSVFSDAKAIAIESESESNMTIAEKISFCSELNFTDISIKTSNKICNRCLDDLAATWRFRKNCETANSLFRSIQQEEEDVVSLANYELECHKTKSPSGLKIRRCNPEIKSYLSTSQIDEKHSEDLIIGTDEENSQNELETYSGFSIVEYIEEDDQKDFVENTNYFDCVGEERLDDLKEIDNKQSPLEEEGYTKRLTKNEKRSRIDSNSRIAFDKNECSEAQIKQEIADDVIDEVDTELICTQTEKYSFSKAEKGILLPIVTSEILQGRVRQNVKEKENGNNPIQPNGHNNVKLIASEQRIGMKRKLNSRRSTTSSEVRAHGASSHKGKSFHSSMKICEICGNVYKYQHALSAHMRRHNNDRQFGCELCDKAFVSNVELRRHMRVHTGHKPYPCSFCDRRFSDFGSRSKHERTHTGERPYHCATCNKSFAYPHVLTVHLRTHTGEKKFQCTRCGRGFTKKTYLLAHLENHARCENISLISRVNNNGSKTNKRPDVHTSQQQELTAIKTVALEECIFTTELINDSEDNTSNDMQIIAQQDAIGHCVMDLEEVIAEEHLDEENDVEYILGVRS